MSSRHASSGRAQQPRHVDHPVTHPVRRTLALVLTAVLAFGTAGAAAAYTQLRSNINTADVSDLIDDVEVAVSTDPDDPNAGQALNILLLGSDQRDGENGVIGGEFAGMRSDTAIVMHVSADRSRVEMVSIPRDSLVDIPSCRSSTGATSRPRSAAGNTMFNEAFAIGADLEGGDVASAAACAINTVQANAGISIDHYVVIDFVGFQRMVDALGGVPMCIPQDIYSEKAGLDLKAGYQTLNGPQALGLARARTGTNLNGSDLQRLGRQQELLAAVAREVLGKNLLTDVGQIMGFFDAATDSLTIDPALNRGLVGLAFSLRNLDLSSVVFMTIPVGEAPSDRNRVVWTSEADAVWAALIADEPVLAGTVPAASSEPTAQTPDGSGSAAPTTGTTASGTEGSPATPQVQETRKAGQEAFSANDVTSVCG